MKFRDGLYAARSHIVFIIALLCAVTLIVWLDGQGGLAPANGGTSQALAVVADFEVLPLAPPRALTDAELEAGRTAWQYFVNNTNAQTGLLNATDKYPSSTMWDTGSFLLGLIAAHRIGIIETSEFDARLDKALTSLLDLELFEGVLPNKAFNVATLAMTSYGNQPNPRGIGWSALDIGRFLVPITYIVWHLPDHAAKASAVLARWDLPAMTRNGELLSSDVTADGQTVYHQEGRLGYEQYGAKSALLRGLDSLVATRFDRSVNFKRIYDLEIPVDTRLIAAGTTPAFTTSEPYILDGLEFGFDGTSHAIASNVYRVQERRFADTDLWTAVSEGHIKGPPQFGYSTIWGGGADWAVMTQSGTRHDSRRTLSTKAAFAWGALFDTAYTRDLVASLAELADPALGWAEGRFEIDGTPNAVYTGNTNAVVLESLSFRRFGPLLGSAR